MITQNILNLIGKTIIGIVQLLPDLPPSWTNAIVSAVGGLGTIAGRIAHFGVIMPWSTLWTAAQIFLGMWLFAALITMIRFVISLVTGGGGAK